MRSLRTCQTRSLGTGRFCAPLRQKPQIVRTLGDLVIRLRRPPCGASKSFVATQLMLLEAGYSDHSVRSGTPVAEGAVTKMPHDAADSRGSMFAG